jgi:hypothetical protein
LHTHARILIWGSFVDFCVCIQPQSNLVIIKSPNEAWRLIVFARLLFISFYFFFNHYYSSSSSSILELVRPNSQKLMIRSLLNFTGRWTPSQEVHSDLGIFKMADVAMEIVNIYQNLWLHLYRKLQKVFPQDLAYILSRVGRIFCPQKSRANGHRQNRQNFNVLWFPWKLISRVILKWGIDW